MSSKLVGGILLIVGTSIGAGMLALPIANSPIGFFNSLLLLTFCWFVMTASALLILEVNLWFPRNSNLISMASATLGRSGQCIAWITYLLLLYSLLAAYIAAGSDFFGNLIHSIHFSLPHWLITVLFTSFLGYIVFRGIHSVDFVNRVLMTIKFAAFFLLIGFILPHIELNKLSSPLHTYASSSMTVTITSFGYATIIPSLRSYFNDDIKKLRTAIIVGSTIPLFCYMLWELAIMGIIPQMGENGLMAILNSHRSTSEFVNQLSILMQRETITELAHVFTSICLLTSFLGVALCLSDFLLDGFRLEKNRHNSFMIQIATLLPPLLIVLLYPGAFITALSYAGIYCVVLLILLPSLMAWHGRYKKNIALHYQVRGGKLLLIFLIAISLFIIGENIYIGLSS